MFLPIRHLVLAASAAALLTACGPRDQETAQQPDANPAATIPTPADEASAPDFVAKAAASDMYEIEAARIAMERSSNAQVKAFAQMMIDGHTGTTNALKAAITSSGLNLAPPTAMPEDKADMLQNLRDADAAKIDRAYMDQQVDAHQAALNLLQRYANDGDNEAIKAFAAATAPAVQDHLTKATQLRDSLPSN